MAEIALYAGIQGVIAVATTSPTVRMQLLANARGALRGYVFCPKCQVPRGITRGSHCAKCGRRERAVLSWSL
eukprot:11187978-Lingulodinium_polyedra.AAC.1